MFPLFACFNIFSYFQFIHQSHAIIKTTFKLDSDKRSSSTVISTSCAMSSRACVNLLLSVHGWILPSKLNSERGETENAYLPIYIDESISRRYWGITNMRCIKERSSFIIISFPSNFVLIVLVVDLNVSSFLWGILFKTLFLQ